MSVSVEVKYERTKNITESLKKIDQNENSVCKDEDSNLNALVVKSEPIEMDLANKRKNSPSTSSALMYSEYMNTSESEKVTQIFQKKTKKPVILSYGESPLYAKYSALLKQLQESKDEFSPEWDKKFPIVSINCLIKRKNEDSDSDTDDGRFVFYGKQEEESDGDSDDDTSDEDGPSTEVKVIKEETYSKHNDKSHSKIETGVVIKEASDSDPEYIDNGHLETETSSVKLETYSGSSCDFIDACVSSSLLCKVNESRYEHVLKKPRLE